jgi:hypothetical protein
VREITTDALDLMRRFGERTGLTGPSGGRRYLWTDAFAVCNFLGLAAATGDATLTDEARRLVERVHGTLGRHRPDEPQAGWLPGASEEHPTRGGLRIGKPLPERGPAEPADERLEWDRDGQYFHYLTKWMHALDRMARATGEAAYRRWACELATTAHRAFAYDAGGGARRMYWKMSIDLARPLVRSMGQHDPLDGWITCVQLATGPGEAPGDAAAAGLLRAAADFRAMLGGVDVVTEDPLGLGGLLTDACRVAQLMEAGASFDGGGDRLLEALLAAALRGLAGYARRGEWRLPADHRLAFRELGLAIGLEAVQWLRHWRGAGRMPAAVGPSLDALERFAPLGEALIDDWRIPTHRAGRTWADHQDINEVMLATALAPDGFLVLDQAA